ncbi:bcl-2-like protein 1 [Spea bombifrons]|uniref:bcl-2-like protein 1 n=1 Tax=Spea bombifrons TaxID=233779 RepID=UPI00234AADD5|nr:bcl-2-like protein 1 [Spea bombifrons]XP_053309057.1 bcl-2-like protein 1 [Spea bombifrons]XP_053309058.1 bcl-2-like protein 1 [Spea bombifrons]
MEGGSKNIVQSFVCEKLSKRDFRWNCCCGSQPEVVSNGTSPGERAEAHVEGHALDADNQEVLRVLLETSEEFELRYQRAFSDLTSQLHITPATAYQSFEQVVGELFRDGTNWGRIVAFFSFGGALCVESADKEMDDLLPRITQWMAIYLDTQLQPWIQEHGGWEEFVSLYGNNAAANIRKSQERFGRWLLTGVTLAGAILLVSYLTRR